MSDATVDLLADLVAINSVNPSLVTDGTADGETAVAERVAQALRAAGLDVEVQEVLPGRPNVIGILEGRSPGATLLLCGHTDTVGVAGMEAPFTPQVRDGRLYGRGAQDMKGGVAAILGAAQRIAASGGLTAGRLVVAAVIDEEYESAGAEDLVRRWSADAAIITEPTDLAIGLGHQGFAWLEVTTEGRAAHGSRPQEGRDAILRMGRVLHRLESLAHDLQTREPHPLLGRGSVHASLIDGGRELSSYPGRCVLQLERRTRIDERPDGPRAEIESILASLHREDPEFVATLRVLFARPAYALSVEHPLARQLFTVMTRRGLVVQRMGTSFWTDAAILGGAGIPTLLFGPGGAGLHSTTEYVRLADVLLCRDILVDLVRSFCCVLRS
jgi:acetylornithine deacetylase